MEERLSNIEKALDLIKSIVMRDKKTLTVVECSRYTGYSISYLYKLTSSKSIPHFKRGKKIYFDKDEIDAWLKQNKVVDFRTEAKNMIVANGK